MEWLSLSKHSYIYTPIIAIHGDVDWISCKKCPAVKLEKHLYYQKSVILHHCEHHLKLKYGKFCECITFSKI